MSKILPIIVVNYNGLEDTVECVESILSGSYQLYKIYLIDNNSNNNDAEFLEKKYRNHSQIKLVFNQKNLGFGKAHNEIFENYLGKEEWEYVALINNDAVIKKDCLSQAVNFADTENVDVLSMKMIDYNNHNQLDCAGHKVLTNGEILPIGKNDTINAYDKVIDNVGASGGACLYSRSCIEKIGFFDPHFFVGYEDAEFGLRAYVTGHKCTYNPEAIVYHKGGNSIKKVFNKNYAVQTFKNIRYTNYKLLPWPILIVMGPLKLIRLILILLISLLTLKWSTASIMIRAFIGFYINDFVKSLKARKELRRNNKVKSSLAILKSMKSMVLHDIENFYSIFVKKKPSATEQYR